MFFDLLKLLLSNGSSDGSATHLTHHQASLFSCWHENMRISHSGATLKPILGDSRTLICDYFYTGMAAADKARRAHRTDSDQSRCDQLYHL
jgi:hypothetical protein